MADLGRWFKLWCCSVTDPHLDNLDIADFGRWAKLGAIIKEQGNGGELTITPPARSICSALQLNTIDDVISCIKKLPNVNVSNETSGCVSYKITFRNWLKYQENLSTDRVRLFRAKKAKNETPKKRREEKRGEETRREKKRYTFIPPTMEEVKAYCEERKNKVEPLKWYDFYESKGWMIGKNKMKDWKAAVRTWENNEKESEYL